MSKRNVIKMVLGSLFTLGGAIPIDDYVAVTPKSKPKKFNYLSDGTAFTRGRRHRSQKSRSRRRDERLGM